MFDAFPEPMVQTQLKEGELTPEEAQLLVIEAGQNLDDHALKELMRLGTPPSGVGDVLILFSNFYQVEGNNAHTM